MPAENQRGFHYQEPMSERLIARINFLYARDFALSVTSRNAQSRSQGT